MNAASRALAQNPVIGSASTYSVNLSRQSLSLLILLLMVLVSALSVVYIKTLNRNLFIELQGLQQTRDELNVAYGQLLLEQNTWAAPARVQSIAQQQMGMILPPAQEIHIIMAPVIK